MATQPGVPLSFFQPSASIRVRHVPTMLRTRPRLLEIHTTEERFVRVCLNHGELAVTSDGDLLCPAEGRLVSRWGVRDTKTGQLVAVATAREVVLAEHLGRGALGLLVGRWGWAD